MMRDFVIKELTPSLRNDFLLFFDHVAFRIILIGLTVTVRRMRFVPELTGGRCNKGVERF